jgi:hypothetical protein
MTAGGWITMLLSLGVVWGGVFWCFRKVLEMPQEEKRRRALARSRNLNRNTKGRR